MRLPLGAQAAVSDDLVFCSKLTSPRERIACYDAAARIAANVGAAASPQPKVLTTAPAGGAPVSYKAAPAEKAPFHGLYIAGGGGFGIVGPIDYGTFDQFGSFGGTAHPSGWSALAAAGYNLQYGHLVVGLEASGRFGREQFSDAQIATLNQPSGIIGQSSRTYDFRSDAGVHLALRAGLAIENTLIYGKFGGGAAHISESLHVMSSGTNCNSVFNGTTFVCERFPFTNGLSSGQTAWLPSIMVGTGIEQNFGPFFARIESQAEAIRGASLLNEWLWTYRAIGAVGYRF